MRQRPLVCFSLVFAVGVGLELYWGVVWHPVLFAVGLLLAVLGRAVSARLAIPAVCLAGLLCGLLYSSAHERFVEQPFMNWNGFHHRITATVVDYPEQYEDAQRVEVRIAGDQLYLPMAVHTLLTLPNTEQALQPGDTLSVHVKFYQPEYADGFDRLTYYRSIGCPLLAKQTPMTALSVSSPDSMPLWYWPKALGHSWQSKLSDWFPQRQAAFLSALLFGEKDGLTIIDTNRLRKAGLSHVVAVSGLHVGFFIGFLLLLFGRRVGSMVGLPLLLAYIIMVGASPSVLRASLMYALVLVAFLIGRDTDSWTSLAAALLLCLILQPVSLLSVGLQLSFAATAGILWLALPMQKALTVHSKRIPHALRQVLNGVTSSIACSFGALLFTMPILLYHFSYLSVLSPLSNLLTLWAVTLVFPLGMLFCLAASVCPPIGHLLAFPISLLVRYIWAVTDFTAGIRGGVLAVDYIGDSILLFVLSAAFLACMLSKRRKVILSAIPIFAVALFGYSRLDSHFAQDKTIVTCFSEGYGQCIAVARGDALAIIDCGSSGYHNAADDVAEYMDWYGLKQIDALILTAANASHTRDVEQLSTTVPIAQTYLAEGEENTLTELETLQFTLLDSDQPQKIGGNSLGISVIPIEGKLAVHIAAEQHSLFVVHSLTQLRLLRLLEQNPLSCDILIAADNLTADADRLSAIVTQIHPQQIVVESGWAHDWDSLEGIPVQFLYEQGDTAFCLSEFP